jgi:hypothetical protein
MEEWNWNINICMWVSKEHCKSIKERQNVFSIQCCAKDRFRRESDHYRDMERGSLLYNASYFNEDELVNAFGNFLRRQKMPRKMS